jgi:apolipoprotein N-acyltransferase
MNVLPVLQAAALGGTPLVVFIVTLPAATVAVAIARGRTIESPALAYGLPLSLVLGAIWYGYARLAETPGMVRVPVGLVAADGQNVLPPEPGGTSDATLAAYLAGATALARQGASLVMLPEKVEFVDERASVVVRDRLASWARDHGTRLVAGFGVFRHEYRDNVAWLFDRNGELVAQYSKQHLVPILEMRYRPGEQDVVVDLDGRRFGIAICKDMGFPALARRYGREGIDAMLTPAWDFVTDAEYHARMAVLRGRRADRERPVWADRC